MVSNKLVLNLVRFKCETILATITFVSTVSYFVVEEYNNLKQKKKLVVYLHDVFGWHGGTCVL